MDFSSTETWIDLLVIFVAVAAVIVGTITVIRMFKHEDEGRKNETPDAKTKTESKKSQSNGKVKKASPKPIFEKISQDSPTNKKTVADNLIKNAAYQPIPKPAEKQKVATETKLNTQKSNRNGSSIGIKESVVGTPPKLDAIQLSLDSPEKLLLKLKNTGQKLIYKKIKTGDHNELSIRYKSPEKNIKSMLEEFPTNSIMTFSLSGSAIISKTYQFTVYFGDMNGNLYTQIIAGMGKEYPIVDKPRKIA